MVSASYDKMAVKIRLMRIGTNRQPFYRVVAVDERKKRTGGYLELLGTYNPLSEPKEINLDQGKIDAWIKKGAVPSYGFLRIIGKAPQRAPRKPKKPARNDSATRNDAAISGEQSDAGGEKKEAPAAAPAAENSAPAEESIQTPAENNSPEAPVVSEENLSEAPQSEPAAEAAEVLEEAKTEEAPAEEPKA